MKKALVLSFIVAFIAILCWGMLNAFAQEIQTNADIVYGFRMQSDMTFYVEAGVILDDLQLIAGLGWNNSIWLGIHKYFYANDEFCAFSGLELHVQYPNNQTLEFHPALPLGFGIITDNVTFIVESLIYPSLTGDPIDVKFAISFLLKL